MVKAYVNKPELVELSVETEAVFVELVLNTEAVIKAKEFDAGEARV